MARVYVSSTIDDLQRERRAVMDWLVASQHQVVHSYRPDSDTVRDSCLDDVDSCDLYVLILGHQYGWQPPDDNPEGLSITHLEFRQACQSGKPRVALLRTCIPDVCRSDLADPRRLPLISAFRDEVVQAVRAAEFSELASLIQGLSTGVQAELDKRADDFQGGAPVLWLAPSPPVLAGREELLAELDARLTTREDRRPRVVALYGLGGAGKTSVAVEYAHRHLHQVGVAWQLPAEDAAVLRAGFSELAAQLGASGARGWNPVAGVHSVLAGYLGEWLLIFDSAPDQETVRAFLPPTGNGRVLITSQNGAWPQGQAVEVPVLSTEVAAAWLVDQTGDPDGQAAAALAAELGGLPLALAQATAYLKATGTTLADYLALFHSRRADLLARGEATGHQADVAATLGLGLSRLKAEAPAAAGLLLLLACLPPEPVPLALLLSDAAIAGDLGPGVAPVVGPFLGDPVAAGDAIAALRRYSLVTLDGDGLVLVHRLVQAIALAQVPEGLADQWEQAAAALAGAVIPADPDLPTARSVRPPPRARAVLDLTSGDETWPDWNNRLASDDKAAVEESMRDLARYANPETLSMLGIGAGNVSISRGSSPADVANRLSAQLQDRTGGYTLEPFNPSVSRRQIIRTAGELLEGQGCSVDFAVAVAAGCVRERADVYLCVAVPKQKELHAHAFLAIPPIPGQPAYEELSVDEFCGYRVENSGYQVVDPTPGPTKVNKMLREYRSPEYGGMVYMVLVQKAVTDQRPFYRPPVRPRSLGITAFLPELPTQVRMFASRERAISRLDAASGTVVVLGGTGVGKSTLALLRAHQAASGRGWFLDGSDRGALRTSFAAAEAQCLGKRLDNVQGDNLDSLGASARHRLEAATRPWVIVVDNADEEPGGIADLVARPGPDQLVIITSTNQAWRTYATKAGWDVIEIGPLERSDLTRDEQTLPLPGKLLLPAMLRLSLAAASTGSHASDGDADVPRMLHALFGDPQNLAARLPTDMVAAALIAAAIMPPGDVRQDWLASSVSRPGEIPAAIDRLIDMGILETSRRIHDVRTPDRRVFWLHQLVRAAVLETYVDVTRPEVLSLISQVLLREPSLSPRSIRSRNDLSMLATLVHEAATHSADPALREAILSVLGSLEPMGEGGVKRAAALARTALNIFPDHTAANWRMRAVPMLAIVRDVLHDRTAHEQDVTAALAMCDELIRRLAADLSVEGKLIQGRTEAMRALLLRKHASRLLQAGDDATALSLLEEVIETLVRSFEERSRALGWEPPPRPRVLSREAAPPRRAARSPLSIFDPDHHIDHSWFNLGSAYITWATVALHRPESKQRTDALVQGWSGALWGYAGSLSLRPEDTMYRAASLYGVALVLYLAASNGVTGLDLSNIPPSEAIAELWAKPDRATLLRVAEDYAIRAHQIRVNISGPFDGETWKTRDLLSKIFLAWRDA